MLKPDLIVFDLNKTLINENSWYDLNLAMGVTGQEDELLVRWGQEGIITDAQAQALLCAIYQKRGNPTRQAITDILHHYSYLPGAQDTVKTLLGRGYVLALISGSMDLLTSTVADELGIQHWASNNRFIFDEHAMLQSIETVENDHEYKLHQLQALCGQLGIGVEQTMCIGDGANDTLLFEACANGVTFHDSAYAEQARYTIRTLPEILDLVD